MPNEKPGQKPGFFFRVRDRPLGLRSSGSYPIYTLFAVKAFGSGPEWVGSRDAIFLACLLSCFFFLANSRWRFSKE